MYYNLKHGNHIFFSYYIHTCLNSFLDTFFFYVAQHHKDIKRGYCENV